MFLFYFRATKKDNKKMEVQLATQEKQIKAQIFVMTNLRNGIDFLKDQCSKGDNSDGNMLMKIKMKLESKKFHLLISNWYSILPDLDNIYFI